MIFNKERIGILLVVLVAVGGILIFTREENQALLTADISQVVNSKSKSDKEDKGNRPDKADKEDKGNSATEVSVDTNAKSVDPGEETIEPAPQPQPQASPVPLAEQKVWVSPTFVPAGGDITVTVDTSEISSFILFVDVYAENADSGQTITGSIVNIDGEGRKFGIVTISSDAEQGAWLIKKVSIVDASGKTTNYHDGKDISVTFTATSP